MMRIEGIVDLIESVVDVFNGAFEVPVLRVDEEAG